MLVLLVSNMTRVDYFSTSVIVPVRVLRIVSQMSTHQSQRGITLEAQARYSTKRNKAAHYDALISITAVVEDSQPTAKVFRSSLLTVQVSADLDYYPKDGR